MSALKNLLMIAAASAAFALAQPVVVASTNSEAVASHLRCIERGRVNWMLYHAVMSFLPEYLEVIQKTTPFKREATLYAGLVEWERYETAGGQRGAQAIGLFLTPAWKRFAEVASDANDVSAVGVRARLYQAVFACLSRTFGLPRGAWREATRDLKASEKYLENTALVLYLCSRFHGCSMIADSTRHAWEKQLKESLGPVNPKGLNKNFVLHHLAARAYYKGDLRAACQYLNQVTSDGHESRAGGEVVGRSFWSPSAFRLMAYARLQWGAKGLLACIGKAGIDRKALAGSRILGDSLLPMEADEVEACDHPAGVLRYVAGEALFDCGVWEDARESFETIRPQMVTASLWRRTQVYVGFCRALIEQRGTGVPLALAGRDEQWREAKAAGDWRTMALLAVLGARFGCGNAQKEAAEILQIVGWREQAMIDYRMDRRTAARAAAAALFFAGMRAPDRGGRRTQLLRECCRLSDKTFDISLAWKRDDDGKHPPVYLAMYGAALAGVEEYEKAYGEIYYELSPVRGIAVAEALKEMWRRIQASRRRQSG